MAKSNVYSTVQTAVTKRELVGNIDYMQKLVLDDLTDLVDWKATATGKIMPAIKTTVEKQIKTCVGVIAQTVMMIQSVHKVEGLTDVLSYQIEETTKKLEELQDYFFRIPIDDITDRRLEFKIGTKKNGEDKMMSIVVASKDDQIQARGTITVSILKIVPLVEQIQTYKANQVRGGRDLDESMALFLEREAKRKSELANDN